MDLKTRVQEVRARVEHAARTAGRDPNDITIIAVTKSVDALRAQEIINCGLTNLGENRVQELLAKQEILGQQPRWHLIGHLQTNKVNKVVGKVFLIHSLDSLRLALELSRRALEQGEPVQALVQVNVAREEQKYGIAPQDLDNFLRQVAAYPGLSVQGLMTIAPLVGNPEEVRPVFRELAKSFVYYSRYPLPGVKMRCLSMGMSNDYAVAVEEGANMIRVGTALFGPRP